MKINFKAIMATLAVSAVSLFTVGCNPVDNVKGWVDQIFCKHETTEIVEAVEPTCTEDGYTEYEKCLECGKEVTKGAAIEATGHTIEVEKGYEATCTTLGLTDKKTCTVCEEVLEEAKYIPVLGHKKVEVKEVKATCAEKGMTAGVVCEHGCGYVFSGCEEIPVVAHSFVNHVCEDCGAVDTATLATLSVDDLTVGAAMATGMYLEVGNFYLLDYNTFSDDGMGLLMEATPLTCEHNLSDNCYGSVEIYSGEDFLSCVDYGVYTVSCWTMDEETYIYTDCNGKTYDFDNNSGPGTCSNFFVEVIVIDDMHSLVYLKETPYSEMFETDQKYWTGKVKVNSAGVSKITFGNANAA